MTAEDRPGRGPAWVAWGLSALLLLLLLGQLTYLYRDVLAHQSPLRPWAEWVCAMAGCTLPRYYDPGAFRVDERTFEFHRHREDVLILRGRLANTAPFRQDFPELHVHMRDMDGHTLGARWFPPEAYLAPDEVVAPGAGGLAPGQAVRLHLELMVPVHEVPSVALGFR